MTRPLRIIIADGHYHVIDRGIERRKIFRAQRDYTHFLERTATLPSRFGVKIHAYALMPNHYHLLLQTPEANLSEAVQWLNVSYSIWFNRKYRRVGPLFQGRFKAILLEVDNALLAVSRYIHLNPVQTMRFRDDPKGLGSAKEGTVVAARQRIKERIDFLRRFPWSSYAALAGLQPVPVWLTEELILSQSGTGAKKEQQAAYRQLVEESIRKGEEDSILEQALRGVAVGSREFLQRVKSLGTGEARQKKLFERACSKRSWESIKDQRGYESRQRGALGTICQPARRFRQEHCTADRAQVGSFHFAAAGSGGRYLGICSCTCRRSSRALNKRRSQGDEALQVRCRSFKFQDVTLPLTDLACNPAPKYRNSPPSRRPRTARGFKESNVRPRPGTYPAQLPKTTGGTQMRSGKDYRGHGYSVPGRTQIRRDLS